MKALVTGASGFIGSTLIEELSTLGFEVVALMRPRSSAANLEGARYERVEGDLSDAESLRRASRGVDYVFHLAGTIFSPDRAGYFRSNAEGTARLAQAVAASAPGLQRFVYVSSLAAAGPAAGLAPRTEADPEAPVSAYGASKLQGERELLKHRDAFPISIVRPPVVYGPREKVLFGLIQSVSRNIVPVIRGSNPGGDKYYSFVHVRDLCRGLAQSALAPRESLAPAEVFYLAGDRYHTYGELISTISDLLGREPLRVRMPRVALRAGAVALTAASFITRKTFSLNLDKLSEMLPDYWICSNLKARERLGFRPEHDLRSGMTDAIEWYKKQEWL